MSPRSVNSPLTEPKQQPRSVPLVGALVPVSVLMSVYHGDRPQWVRACLDSILNQTQPPREVVIVEDGPISPELAYELELARIKAGPVVIKTLPLSANAGLGPALQAGLDACSHDLVARIDADDLCVLDRFAVQAAAMLRDPELQLLGGWHEEFDDDPDLVHGVKRTPEANDSIVRLLRWRNCISHPTIMFRKSTVTAIGGYRDVRYLEDYDLFLRLAKAGCRMGALQRSIVKVRTTPGQRSRRGGLGYLARELTFRWRALRAGQLNIVEFLVSSVLYAGFRLVPNWARARAYRMVRARPMPPAPTFFENKTSDMSH